MHGGRGGALAERRSVLVRVYCYVIFNVLEVEIRTRTTFNAIEVAPNSTWIFVRIFGVFEPRHNVLRKYVVTWLEHSA